MGDPIEITHLKRLYADARQDFASDVDALLTELRTFSESLGGAIIGPETRVEALRAVRQFVLEKFDQRLPLRNRESEIETLRQLVQEAYDIVTNPASQVDLRDWARSAAPFVRR